MSDDEYMHGSDDDPYFDDEEELAEIRREAERRRQQAAQPARRRAPIPVRRDPPQAPQIFPGFGGGIGGFGTFMQQAMNGGFPLGHGARPSAAMFRNDYRAWSTSIYEAEQGRMDRINGGRQNLMFGGSILMPPEALDVLTRMDVEPPWTFELINPQDRSRHTHAGVLEFTAPAGMVYLPQWMMERLGFEENANVRIMGASLPKGKFVKLQPQELTFLELSDPKAVLEKALSNFPCLTVGDIIEISHQHINLKFLIMEAKSHSSDDAVDAINILNTDIEVDFAPPVGYVEPARAPPKPLPTMADKLGINVDQKDDKKHTDAGFSAFVGSGNSLGGKKIKGKGTKTRKIEEMDPESRLRRTDRQTFINANDMSQDREVPAALNLPFGHLFFGYNLVPRPNGASSDLADTTPQSTSFQGAGATLSGRNRPSTQSTSSSSANQLSSKVQATEKKSGFQGSGNTLGKRREVIEID